MTQGIAEVLTFAVGVAISPVPIIAVILMLFSARAEVNGPLFMTGWAIALLVVSGVTYLAEDAATDTSSTDAVSWSQVVPGLLLLLLAARSWRHRPAPGAQPEQPAWMQGIDTFSPGKALALGLLLAGVNPKNLLLAAGAGAALAGVGLATGDAVVSLLVFVAVGSVTIAGPVIYYLLGGEHARTTLDAAKGWLALHNDAVMTVLFLVFGVSLVAQGVPPLT
jgi:hypothetical protein